MVLPPLAFLERTPTSLWLLAMTGHLFPFPPPCTQGGLGSVIGKGGPGGVYAADGPCRGRHSEALPRLNCHRAGEGEVRALTCKTGPGLVHSWFTWRVSVCGGLLFPLHLPFP